MARIMYVLCESLHHELRVGGNHLTKHLLSPRFGSGTNTNTYISCEYMFRARLARVIAFASCYSTYALALCRHVLPVVMSARLPFAVVVLYQNNKKKKLNSKGKKKNV